MSHSEQRTRAYQAIRRRTELPEKAKRAVTADNWKIFLQYTANGATRAAACQAAQISAQTVQAHLLTDPDATSQLKNSELAWIRRDWPLERIDEFLAIIASGKLNKDAAVEMEFMDGELEQLLRVILADTAIRALYDQARELQAEAWGDEMIEIADESEHDQYTTTDRQGNEYTKIDHEVVNRSKLRVQARQWLMARLHHKRFGDRIQQDITGDLTVNHAELLDDARRRREQAKQHAEARATAEDQPNPETRH